ncbi:MAG: TetR/AcrR family transcriptional regulator [Bacteroidia bacterium]
MNETVINRREQIIETAAKLFCNKGFESATMRDIAAEMGVEAASLYHHIGSKDEILKEICFSMADKFIDAINEVNDIYFNAEEKLRLAIRNHAVILAKNPFESLVFINEWRSLAQPGLDEFIKLRNDYENGIKNIVKNGIEEDVFDDVDLKFATISILSTLNGIIQWYKPDGDMNAEQIAQKLSDFILGGLRKKLVTDINYKP